MSHEYGHRRRKTDWEDPDAIDRIFGVLGKEEPTAPGQVINNQSDFDFFNSDSYFRDSSGIPSGNKDKGKTGSDWVDKFNMGGNILGGLGDLASGWAALQNVGIARQSQKFKEDAWRQNMARQKTTVNNPIRMQQSVLKSDFYNDPARANSLKLVT